MSTIVGDLLSGAGEGLLSGLGKCAKGLRESITGKEIITGQERMALLNQVSQLENAVLQAENSLNLAQVELDKEEAKSDNIFKSGWRPAVGWLCVLGLFYQFIFRPLMPWLVQTICDVSGLSIKLSVPPNLDTSTLMTLLFGMLGLGGFRTFEKIKGMGK